MKSIIFLVNSAPEFAGVQRYILNTAKELEKRGFSAYIWSSTNPFFMSKLKNSNIKYFEYKGSVLSLGNIYKLLKLIKKNNTKIVHANLGKSAIVGAILKKLTNIKKLVFTQHFISPASTSLANSSVKRYIAKFLYRHVYSKYDRIIAISTDVADKIMERKESSSKKIEIIYNGIPAVAQKIIENKKSASVLVICRLQKEKNIYGLLNIMAAIKSDCDFNMKILGSGKEEQSLLDLSKNLKLDNHIEFCGHVEDTAKYYNKASFLVHPAKNEPFGLVLIEAMSAKLPIITFNSGGPKDIVEDGVTGFLVNSDIEMKEKIIELLENKDKRQKMGQAAYERYKSVFTIEKMVDSLMKIYEDK
jgi:glycosyltransferase involved in cell wall biosynthesis